MVYQFTTAAEAVGATVQRFPDTAAAITYLGNLIGTGKVSFSAVPKEYEELLEAFSPAALTEYPDVGFCISVARAGIARTGSLLLELRDPAERSATALAPIPLLWQRPAIPPTAAKVEVHHPCSDTASKPEHRVL